MHGALDFPVAFRLVGAFLGHVVLLFRALTPIGLRTPSNRRQASVLMLFTGLNGLQAFGRVPVLVVTDVAFETKGAFDDLQ